MKNFGFIFLIFLLGCQNKPQNVTVISPTNKPINVGTKPDYANCKKQILINKQTNLKTWQNLTISQKEKIFVTAITKNIIPSWIGTAWDFNGVTQTPQQGSIACGYFVTTVLQDGGVNLARIKLAQCASEQMITTLVTTKYISRFSNLPITSFVANVKNQGYGLYIVGLDNHTGFIYNDGTTVYFIHSTFVGTRNVQQEKAESSIVLASSKYKVLGKISADENFLNRWIKY
jgi:hypothetical protein